jgi:hypothetical protein
MIVVEYFSHTKSCHVCFLSPTVSFLNAASLRIGDPDVLHLGSGGVVGWQPSLFVRVETALEHARK